MANPLQRALSATVPKSGTALQTLIAERFDGSTRKFVRNLVQAACAHCIRSCSARCEHAKSIICKGRAGAGLGLFVFSYDQRIPNSQWNECTALCRGLVVVTPLQDNVEDGTFLKIESLSAVLDNETLPVEVAECMPKFWEYGEGKGEVSWKYIQQSFGSDPAVVGVHAAVEKIDGNLGLIHPARHPTSLESLPDAFPLLATKSVGWSNDIVKQRALLREQHPTLTLPPGVTSVVVEVVTKTHQVCVPYAEEGFRLLAAVRDGQWLSHQELTDLGAQWGMPLPPYHPLPPSAGTDPAGCLEELRGQARAFTMKAGALLSEGFVVQLRNGLRLKIHTEAWDIVNKLWGGEITAKTVLPLVLDTRVNGVALSEIEKSIVGGKEERAAAEKVEKLRSSVKIARREVESCVRCVREALKETATTSLKCLKQHPMEDAIKEVRGRPRWVDSIPDDVAIDTLDISFGVYRGMFEQRAAAAEDAAERERDDSAVASVTTALLKRVFLCADELPGASLADLEKSLGESVPGPVQRMLIMKGRVDARRLKRVVQQREERGQGD